MGEIDIITIREGSAQNPRTSEASVIELDDGSLLGAWAEFSLVENSDHDLGVSAIVSHRSYDGGYTWVERRVLASPGNGERNTYGANLLKLPGGEILFFYFHYIQLLRGEPVISQTYVRRSVDGGRSFSPPEALFKGDMQPFSFANDVARLLSGGRIVIPVVGRTGNLWEKDEHRFLAAALSDDGGRTFRLSEGRVDLPMRGAMEGNIEELPDGRLIMVMRSQLGSVFRSYSRDGGSTWSKPQTAGLRCPESCNTLRRVPGTGDLLLIWNNSEYDMGFPSHYGRRSPLTAAVSKDGGETWGNVKNIESDPKYVHTNAACAFFKNRAIITYWHMRYTDDDRMKGLISLKAAIFDRNWLYR